MINDTGQLYFIALVVREPLRAKITEWKELCRDRYGAAHALKSPPHITLQRPFKRDKKIETHISGALQVLAEKFLPITCRLDRTGHFDRRTLYLHVADNDPIMHLAAALQSILRDQWQFQSSELSGKIKPHITLATRDLKEAQFSAAWNYFSPLDINETFIAERISLLRHNGKTWDVLDEIHGV